MSGLIYHGMGPRSKYPHGDENVYTNGYRAVHFCLPVHDQNLHKLQTGNSLQIGRTTSALLFIVFAIKCYMQLDTICRPKY